MVHHYIWKTFAGMLVVVVVELLMIGLQSKWKLAPTVPHVYGHLTAGKSRFPEIQENSDAIPASQVPASPAGINASLLHYIDRVKKGFSHAWISNDTRKTGVRKKLNSILDAKEFAVMTKRLAKIGMKIKNAISKNTREMTRDLYTSLPEKSPFANETLHKCSVVGNGGILANSRCGTEINSADFVFRCNSPPLLGYMDDTGNKTSIASINPTIIGGKYKRLLNQAQRSTFIYDMKNYGRLLIPVFGVSSGYMHSASAVKLLHTSKSSRTKALIINPDHFRAVAKSWAEMGLKNRMTSGFYLTSLALSVCDSVEIFGFWPFPIDTNRNPVPHHYYKKGDISHGVHNYNFEFDVLYQFHIDGVLRMHVSSCMPTS